MTGLQLADDFALRADTASTQTFAVLAKRRAGKTYTAAVMAEEMVVAGLPFYALDPTSAWWGLRAAANARDAGLPVTVIGGAHGDVPLEPTAGKVIAELVVEAPGFYVLDLGLLESHAATVRFATAFLDRLYRLKSRHRDPLHGFWDEADLFAPQRPGPDETKMLGAAEAIVRRGGIRGLGTTLITQRPAVLNKNVLTQVDALILLRVISPQDRAAVDEYVKGNATPEERAELLGSLASLKLGEAWVYAPGEDPPVYRRINVRERRTFNSSATPKPGQKRLEPKRLADVDLEALRARMVETIERAEAEDPVRLRQRVRALERQLAERPKASPAPVLVAKRVEVPVVGDELRSQLERATSGLSLAQQEIVSAVADIGRAIDEARELLARLTAGAGAAGAAERARAPVRGASPPPAATPAGAVATATGDGGSPALKAGARRMLEALASLHPMPLTRAQVGTLAKVKRTGGTFSTYLGHLRVAGYIAEDGERLSITPDGLDAIGVNVPQPKTGPELLELWRDRLKAGGRRMLEVLVDAYPQMISRDELAERAGIERTGGTFSTYLGHLRTAGLITEDDGLIRANEVLFLGAGMRAPKPGG
jgi:hypothetical protein